MKIYIYNFKDQNPIRFEIFQSDMENIMFALGEAQKIIGYYGLKHAKENNFNEICVLRMLTNIKEDLQHKINIHKKRGEWK